MEKTCPFSIRQICSLTLDIAFAHSICFPREQQYAQMWSELETLVRAHVSTSDEHGQVLECLLECKKPSDDKRKTDKGAKDELSEVESAWKDLDR